jgi:hypothetical protein
LRHDPCELAVSLPEGSEPTAPSAVRAVPVRIPIGPSDLLQLVGLFAGRDPNELEAILAPLGAPLRPRFLGDSA